MTNISIHPLNLFLPVTYIIYLQTSLSNNFNNNNNNIKLLCLCAKAPNLSPGLSTSLQTSLLLPSEMVNTTEGEKLFQDTVNTPQDTN